MRWFMDFLKKMDKTRWLIVGLFGILLLVIAVPVDDMQEKKQEQATHQALLSKELSDTETNEYEKYLEQKLARMLSAMDGVGSVQVMITFQDTEEQFYVSRQETPLVEGILVIAQGGDDSVVKKSIQEAVMALFPLDAHKIKIVKMGTKS